jgi:hypothetical protein
MVSIKVIIVWPRCNDLSYERSTLFASKQHWPIVTRWPGTLLAVHLFVSIVYHQNIPWIRNEDLATMPHSCAWLWGYGIIDRWDQISTDWELSHQGVFRNIVLTRTVPQKPCRHLLHTDLSISECIVPRGARQLLGKHVPTTINISYNNRIVGRVIFSIRSVSYERRVCGSVYPSVMTFPLQRIFGGGAVFYAGPCRLKGKQAISFSENF